MSAGRAERRSAFREAVRAHPVKFLAGFLCVGLCDVLLLIVLDAFLSHDVATLIGVAVIGVMTGSGGLLFERRVLRGTGPGSAQ